MDPYDGTPVFIDVERTPNQYVLTQELCHSLLAQTPKVETRDQSAVVGQVKENAPSLNTRQTTIDNCLLTITRDVSLQETTMSTMNPVPGQSTVEKSTVKPEPDTSCLNIVPRRIRCPECHRYTAENEEKMLRHIKKVHKGENPFQCYMCDYSTYNKSLFEEHVRIHQGIKPFKCFHCDYKSASKKNLKKHELIHRPNNPLKCSQCEFIARHPKALKRHQDTHATADWLKFDTCKFRFKDMEAFNKHEKTHKVKCKECEFKTCSRPYLKRHMVKEHDLKEEEAVKKESFTCQICGWTSSTMAKILLHLIHHPKQTVDETVIDISVLKKHGIMT